MDREVKPSTIIEGETKGKPREGLISVLDVKKKHRVITKRRRGDENKGQGELGGEIQI